jgi:splicing factor U2AF subunit
MGLGGGAALTSNLQQTKNARRLYVGGIPPGADEQEVARFFNDVITKATGGTEGLSPVLSVYINHEKFFAFVELNSVELTTACGQLDGIEYKGKSGSVAVRVRRPNDFRPELLPAPTRPIPILDLSGITGSAATSIPDGPNKIYIGNVPVNLGEEQVRELLEAFGALKAFHLLRDPATRLSKGYGYCEYVDPAATPIAVEGLHNLPIGDKILIAHLSSTLNTGDTAVAVTANIEPTKV